MRSGRSKDLEIIVLRHQLGVLRRRNNRPQLARHPQAVTPPGKLLTTCSRSSDRLSVVGRRGLLISRGDSEAQVFLLKIVAELFEFFGVHVEPCSAVYHASKLV